MIISTNSDAITSQILTDSLCMQLKQVSTYRFTAITIKYNKMVPKLLSGTNISPENYLRGHFLDLNQ